MWEQQEIKKDMKEEDGEDNTNQGLDPNNAGDDRKAQDFPLQNPWEFVAPFCRSAVPSLSFYLIPIGSCDTKARDMASCAMITAKEGIVNAR